MFVNKKPNLYFNESKFYFINYLNSKIRTLFRKIDKLDFFYSKILHLFYKFLKCKSFFNKIKIMNNKNEIVSIEDGLQKKGFLSLENNGENDKINNLVLLTKTLFSKEETEKKLFDEGQKKNFLRSCRIDLRNKENYPYLEFLFTKNILHYLCEYLDNMLVLKELTLLYSENKKFEKGRSQEFHMDGDDQKQIKLRVNISSVDLNNGPLTVISKEDTRLIFDSLEKKKIIKKKSTKIDDEKIFNISKNIKYQTLIGKEGTIDMVDTSNCYHFGSRPGNRPRLILEYQFLTPFSYNLPFIGTDQTPSYIGGLEIEDSKKKILSNILRYYTFK
tara:strand:+ start:2298 stop:3290 length:993 start_codon:yes stop_codon:yes gene_type:complete